MASAAEQMAANLSWGQLGRATELRQLIWFTIGLLIIYSLGTYIPVPGIDGAALRNFMEQAQSGIGGMLSMFTGGALGRPGRRRGLGQVLSRALGAAARLHQPLHDRLR